MEIKPFSEDISYGNEDLADEISTPSLDQTGSPDGFREITRKEYDKAIKKCKFWTGENAWVDIANTLVEITKTGKANEDQQQILKELGFTIQDLEDTRKKHWYTPWREDQDDAERVPDEGPEGASE